MSRRNRSKLLKEKFGQCAGASKPYLGSLMKYETDMASLVRKAVSIREEE